MTPRKDLAYDELLTPAEVAKIFRVDAKTVARWTKQRKFRVVRTLGGHSRFYAAEISAFIDSTRKERTR